MEGKKKRVNATRVKLDKEKCCWRRGAESRQSKLHSTGGVGVSLGGGSFVSAFGSGARGVGVGRLSAVRID